MEEASGIATGSQVGAQAPAPAGHPDAAPRPVAQVRPIEGPAAGPTVARLTRRRPLTGAVIATKDAASHTDEVERLDGKPGPDVAEAGVPVVSVTVQAVVGEQGTGTAVEPQVEDAPPER